MQRKLALLLGLVAAVSAITIACNDSDDGDATATAEGGMEHAHADDVGVLAALATLANADLHHVDNALTGDEPEIDPTWIAPLTNARTAVALIEWPEELHDAAQAFLDDSMPLLMALQDDDLETAVETASQAHASWHLLRDPGYAYLAEQAGTGSMSDMEDGHDHEHEDGDDDMEMDDDGDS